MQMQNNPVILTSRKHYNTTIPSNTHLSCTKKIKNLFKKIFSCLASSSNEKQNSVREFCPFSTNISSRRLSLPPSYHPHQNKKILPYPPSPQNLDH